MQKVKNAFSHFMRFPQILKNHSVAKIKNAFWSYKKKAPDSDEPNANFKHVKVSNNFAVS